MRITVDLLQSLDACSPGIEAFKQFLNGRKYVLPTQQNLQLAADAGLSVQWLLREAKLTAVGLRVHVAQFWYRNGRVHREGGPAVLYDDGTGYWYENGAFIRSERP